MSSSITDICIPEGEAMRRIEKAVLKHWMENDQQSKRLCPHEFMYEITLSPSWIVRM